MVINKSLFSILLVAALTENLINVYASFETKMKTYNGGTVTRKVAVKGKPKEYTNIKYLNYGCGTAIYKTDYNGVVAALKILEPRAENRHLQYFLKNEQFILDKLKDGSKSAEELGYVKLYDYIEEGHLVAKATKEEVSKPADLRLMAIVITYFDTDLFQYIENQYPIILEDVNWMRSKISKVIEALWHIHQRGILHNDVSLQNIGLIGDKVVLFDFGISVVYNASARIKDMIYFRDGIPVGNKPVLSWNAVMHPETYLRKFVDDIISAILSFWDAHGDLPWCTRGIENAFQGKLIEEALNQTEKLRSEHNKNKYKNMMKHYGPDILMTSIDVLLQTLYEKATSNPNNLDYQDLLNECNNLK